MDPLTNQKLREHAKRLRQLEEESDKHAKSLRHTVNALKETKEVLMLLNARCDALRGAIETLTKIMKVNATKCERRHECSKQDS